MTKLGKAQTAVLKSLREHGQWQKGCGWLWDTPSGTERVMETLVERGVAKKTMNGIGKTIYWPAEEKPAEVYQKPKSRQRKKRPVAFDLSDPTPLWEQDK